MSIAVWLCNGRAPAERNVSPIDWRVGNGHSIDIGSLGFLVIHVF